MFHVLRLMYFWKTVYTAMNCILFCAYACTYERVMKFVMSDIYYGYDLCIFLLILLARSNNLESYFITSPS